MSFNLLCFSIIIHLWKICLSSFHLWARIMVTHLSNLFFFSFIFLFCIIFWTFFPHVFSLIWSTTPIYLTLPMLFLLLLFIFASKLAFMGLVVQPCKSLASAPFCLPYGFALLANFYCHVDDINIVGVFFSIVSSFHPFCKKLWVKMFAIWMWSQC